MRIRREASGDEAAISAVTEAAFKEAPHSNQTEAAIVVALRMVGALSVSLVATNVGDAVIGHVAFSPITIDGEDQGWHGLGPVSVMSAYQGQGIGSDLINGGLARLKTLGARGCVVLGDPAYYCRFGFRSNDALTYSDVPREYFQALSFTGSSPAGIVAYHPGFDVT